MESDDISDEQLMAFADGELTGEEARSVEDAMMADPELAARVETFRRTRALVAEASRARPMASERDAALIAKIRAAAGRPPKGAAPSPHAGGQATRKILRPANSNWMPTAVAAGVALALVIGWWSGLFGGGPRDGGLEQALVAALESVPSGETAPVNGSEFTAIASYHTEGGELCREYEVHGTATATVAVACHGPEGLAKPLHRRAFRNGRYLRPGLRRYGGVGCIPGRDRRRSPPYPGGRGGGAGWVETGYRRLRSWH